uniref:Uncharacterized protein n=1 Tax=Romanomermis culicivorax TaxID=13658 RepID=A0A915JIX5_ROMCU
MSGYGNPGNSGWGNVAADWQAATTNISLARVTGYFDQRRHGVSSYGQVTVVVTYMKARGENMQILFDEQRRQLTI